MRLLISRRTLGKISVTIRGHPHALPNLLRVQNAGSFCAEMTIWRVTGTSGRLYVELLTRALALRFLGIASDTRDVKLVSRSKLPTFALSRVLERMELEAAEDLDLHTLARESGYSKSQFLRMFCALI